MAFIIEWVEECLGAEEVLEVLTPASTLRVIHRDGVICQMDWVLKDINEPQTHELQQKFAAYWINPAQSIPVKLLKQGSAYRHSVWSALTDIPRGETLTYSALAKIIHSSARAVGNACRDNPYPVVIPCHRVVSMSGMGGYCGQTQGDLMAIKHTLLGFDAKYLRQ